MRIPTFSKKYFDFLTWFVSSWWSKKLKYRECQNFQLLIMVKKPVLKNERIDTKNVYVSLPRHWEQVNKEISDVRDIIKNWCSIRESFHLPLTVPGKMFIVLLNIPLEGTFRIQDFQSFYLPIEYMGFSKYRRSLFPSGDLKLQYIHYAYTEKTNTRSLGDFSIYWFYSQTLNNLAH